MKVIAHHTYGSPDVLELKDIERPVPKANEVLVRVRAVGLHVGDCFVVRGAPLPIRLVTGLFKPRRGIPGHDVAGVVEAVGGDVTRFKPGAEVFGGCTGSCAEYVCVREDRLAPKPDGLTMEQAGGMPTPAPPALRPRPHPGQVRSRRARPAQAARPVPVYPPEPAPVRRDPQSPRPGRAHRAHRLRPAAARRRPDPFAG